MQDDNTTAVNGASSKEESGSHLHLHFHDLPQEVAQELVVNLAMDMKLTREKIEMLIQELQQWQTRKEQLEQMPEPSLQSAVNQKILNLRQAIQGEESHFQQLKEEVQRVQSSAEQGREHEIKRAMVKETIEKMMGQSMKDILLDEQLTKMENEKKADQDLENLKKEMRQDG